MARTHHHFIHITLIDGSTSHVSGEYSVSALQYNRIRDPCWMPGKYQHSEHFSLYSGLCQIKWGIIWVLMMMDGIHSWGGFVRVDSGSGGPPIVQVKVAQTSFWFRFYTIFPHSVFHLSWWVKN